MSPHWPGHGVWMDVSHPWGPAGPWDISARGTAPIPSPVWVGSASPGHFVPSPEHPSLPPPGQLPFGAHFGLAGGDVGLQQCVLPGYHNPVPWMHFSKQFLQGWGWAHGAWPSVARGCLGQPLSPSHGCYPAVGPQWDSESPCPMHWMYSAHEAEMLPCALHGHMELWVSGNWDRNICWGGSWQ